MADRAVLERRRRFFLRCILSHCDTVGRAHVGEGGGDAGPIARAMRWTTSISQTRVRVCRSVTSRNFWRYQRCAA